MRVPEQWYHCFVGLGSNMGDAPLHLMQACRELEQLPYVRGLELSPVYCTEPQLVKEQNWFHNQVARLCCDVSLEPLHLLDDLLALEDRLGRDRNGAVRYGPRVIDLDLLLFADVSCQTDRLVLPHPRLLERAFVLVPLNDIAPALLLPNGKNPQQTLAGLVHTLEGNCIRQ